MNLIHVAEDITISDFHKKAGWPDTSACGASGYGSFSAHPPSIIWIFMQLESLLDDSGRETRVTRQALPAGMKSFRQRSIF
jgi:hypothetical protein